MQAMLAEFWSHCESNFWANSKTTNPNFHEVFDQSNEVWQVFFVYLFLIMFLDKNNLIGQNIVKIQDS